MIKPNAILEIKTKNLIHNYKTLSTIASSSLAGATLKANAYGIGDLEIYKLLYKNNCRHFFFASLDEALTIRKKFRKGNIYVLNGIEDHNFNIFKKFNIVPILNSRKELKKFVKNNGINKKIKIGLQVETGLNRLGISIKDLGSISTNKLDLQILISHLASSDELKNKYNQKQNNNFRLYFNLFKSIKYKSLVSSMGILLGKDFHYDLIRPGISIYGGHYNSKLKKKIMPVVILKAKILQIKTLSKNEYVGYNQTYKTHDKIIIAILGIGYGDGISRILSNNGDAMYKNETFKIIGRISMDTITLDITKSKNDIQIGQYCEIINTKNYFDIYHKVNKFIQNIETIENSDVEKLFSLYNSNEISVENFLLIIQFHITKVIKILTVKNNQNNLIHCYLSLFFKINEIISSFKSFKLDQNQLLNIIKSILLNHSKNYN